MSSRGCKASCIVMNFLVYLSSLFVHFKKDSELILRIILTTGTAQVFIPLMSFLLQKLLSTCNFPSLQVF